MPKTADKQYGSRIQRQIVENPPQYLLATWVDAYKRVGEYLIEDIPFYVRPLTREEYRFSVSRATNNALLFEELVCQKATLWPQDFDFLDPAMLAGIPTQLSTRIVELSGFTEKSAAKILEYWQEQVYEQDERRDLLIQLAFPDMKFDVLDRLDADDYFHYLAAAEFRIRTQLMTSTNPEFSPDELVDLLMCSREDVEKRMDKAREAIEKLVAEEQQEQVKRARSERAERAAYRRRQQ